MSMKVLTSAIQLWIVVLLSYGHVAAQALAVEDLRCEYKTNPIGIDVEQVRLSWKLKTAERNILQTAYQIRVATSEAELEKGKKLVWDSGKVTSNQSIQIPYTGPTPSARQRLYWQVKIWDNQNRESNWSKAAYWEMGLLKPSDWTAQWIQSAQPEDVTKSQPSPLLRTTFDVKGKIKRARAYITSHGLYEAHLNGKRVGDELLTPGWTAYQERLQYQTYDVTSQLQQGANAIGVQLGDGWYRGWLAWQNRRNTYGDKLALLLQLEIEYENGTIQKVVSDSKWKSSTGPILLSDIYNGEQYDARQEKEGWTTASYDAKDWGGVRIVEISKEKLIAPAGPPVKRIEEIKPVRIFTTPKGEVVADMGQNMVGWIRLNLQANAGTTVTLHHAEVLDKFGNFYTDNLRSAKQEIVYICKGGGKEIYEPHFTFQGFRYVKVDGITPTADNITGIVVHSDMKPTGSFECSNALLNQLQRNIQWGQKGNFVDVPTDCPQRDERLGWTGDAEVFAPTAAYNMNVAGFFTKWLGDLATDQLENGSVPFVIPHVLGKGAAGATGWGDAATIIPWTLYQSYGDTRILERQYESMKAWVEFMRKEAGDNYLWQTGFHFGDWLYYNSTDPGAEAAFTDKDLLATAFFAHSTNILRKSAQLLGKEADVKTYSALYENIKKAFQQEFITPTGRISPNTQTAYTLALAFDLVPENLRKQVAEKLVGRINYYGNHISTGFLGTPHIMFALSENGHLDAAYKLLLQESYPSWLYPVKMGATTIWERWDGMKPDSTFQDVGMNSFNHYAYGAVGDWMYRNIAGINSDADQPGYKHSIIRPQPGGNLEFANASLETMYGTLKSEWKIQGEEFTLQVTVPANTTATVYLPQATLKDVKEGGKPLSLGNPQQEGSQVRLELGSGTYTFTYPMTEQQTSIR